MMTGMRFSSAVMTRRIFAWASMFTLAVSVAEGQGVTLRTSSRVFARCGENVTLACEAISSGQLDMKTFSWVAKKRIMCHFSDERTDSEVLCESKAEPTNLTLTLTLLNVMPVDQAEYLCKFRSTSGVKEKTTVVTVQDCVGRSGSFIDDSHAGCWFSGVYPRGTVHWFQGDENLTHSASTQEEMEPRGSYNVSSTIDAQTGNLSQSFDCSLWIPSSGKVLSFQSLPLVGRQLKSSGRTVELQWICIMVGIMKCMI